VAGSEHDDEHSVQRRRVALLRREWQLSLYPQAAEAGGCLVTMDPGRQRDATLTPTIAGGGGSSGSRRSAVTAPPPAQSTRT
jgi:hypothetical protein